MITVRQATTADVAWLLEELAQFDAFFGAQHSLYPDAETAREFVTMLVETQPFFLAESESGRIGFIAGALHPHPYNPSLRVLTEMFWWVAPAYRGSRAGFALLSKFIEHGRANAKWTVMTLEADSPVHPETLTRRGFRLKETSYLLES